MIKVRCRGYSGWLISMSTVGQFISGERIYDIEIQLNGSDELRLKNVSTSELVIEIL